MARVTKRFGEYGHDLWRSYSEPSPRPENSLDWSWQDAHDKVLV